MSKRSRPIRITNEDTMAAALKQFGWVCGPEFWKRYHTDPWVFHLANAVEKLTERLATADQEDTP